MVMNFIGNDCASLGTSVIQVLSLALTLLNKAMVMFLQGIIHMYQNNIDQKKW